MSNHVPKERTSFYMCTCVVFQMHEQVESKSEAEQLLSKVHRKACLFQETSDIFYVSKPILVTSGVFGFLQGRIGAAVEAWYLNPPVSPSYLGHQYLFVNSKHNEFFSMSSRFQNINSPSACVVALLLPNSPTSQNTLRRPYVFAGTVSGPDSSYLMLSARENANTKNEIPIWI
jgi:hypothetical protein